MSHTTPHHTTLRGGTAQQNTLWPDCSSCTHIQTRRLVHLPTCAEHANLQPTCVADCGPVLSAGTDWWESAAWYRHCHREMLLPGLWHTTVDKRGSAKQTFRSCQGVSAERSNSSFGIVGRRVSCLCRIKLCFSATVTRHTSAARDNVRWSVKNDPISFNWYTKINTVKLLSGCA